MVGINVGFKEDFTDGIAVEGVVVGETEGAGVLLGDLVGFGENEALGAKEGEIVGDKEFSMWVGFREGLDVVGKVMGLFEVGIFVGEIWKDGRLETIRDGRKLGKIVGLTVGST